MTSLRQQRAILRTRHALHGLSPKQKRAAMLRGAAQAALLKKMPPKDRAKRLPVPKVPLPRDPFDYRWYVLLTKAQQERKAAARLHKAGYAAFCPVEKVEAKTSRVVKNQRHLIERPVLTSMVLVGCELGRDMPWLFVLDRDRFPEVFAPIVFNGAPVEVSHKGLDWCREKNGSFGRTRDYTPLVDDDVRIVDGSLLGLTGKVVEVVKGAAMVKLAGLGGVLADLAEPAKVDENWLEPV